MKNILKAFMIGLAAAALFVGCAKEESTNDPYATNFVYLWAPESSTYKATFSVMDEWKSKPDSILSFMQIHCTKPAPQDINVTVEIDESLVASYNAENGTDYEFLSCIKLVKDQLVIKKGEYLSVDTLKTRISDYDFFIEGGTQKYIVPVKMTSASSGKISERSVFYIFYEANKLFAEVLDNSYSGVQLDRSDWKIYLNEFGGNDVTAKLTDGSKYSEVYYLYGTNTFYVDLGQEYDNITNVGVMCYGASYSVTNMKVEVSSDNVDYTDLGTFYTYRIGHPVIDFYVPQKARYVKITGYDPIDSYYGWDVCDIYVATAAE